MDKRSSGLPRINDYLLRLQHTSAPELAERLRRTLLAWHWRHRLARGLLPPHPAHIDATAPEHIRLPEMHSNLDAGAIVALLDGNLCTLNTDPDAIRAFEAYQRDRFFSRVQSAKDGLDIRAVWEPSRLQHFTALLAHLRRYPEESGLDAIEAFVRQGLDRWVRDNRFLQGPHYMSAMECGLRIPVFVLALRIIDDWPADERRRIAQAIYAHGGWVYRNLSLYASLGNHTICEAVGLVFGGALFNDTDEGRRWLNRGIELLEQELDHQILDDGGPAEQSLGYHRFVLDLYLLASDFLKKNGLHDTRRITGKLALAESFLKAFECSGLIPSIGDSDDGNAVAPGCSPRRPEVPECEAGIMTFMRSGYTVIRTPGNGVFTLDHGPLGLPPLYNHGHADALSITLTLQGQAFLVDPGTYRYNGVDAHRRYFKGTSAHNTVTIDRADQAVWAGGFAWKAPFQTEVLKHSPFGENPFEIEAMHDGYRRLSSSVIHKRRVRYTDGRFFRVVDSFEGSGKHEFTLHYHLGPGIETDEIPGGWRLRSGSAKVEILFPGGDRGEKVRGRTDPLLGWYSRAYGAIEPCDVLQYRKTGNAKDVSFETIILLTEHS